MPPAPPPAGREPLPGRPTPTWEMELLLSGATVFSLLKVPGLLDDAYFAYLPALPASYGGFATMLFLYLMAACLALIATFLAHLCVRGYWVALVGLHSVYPGGIQWQRLHWGPAFIGALRRRARPLEEVIENYDNRASQVFGFGIGLTALAVAIMLLFGLLTVLALAVHELSRHAIGFDLALFTLLGALFVPYLLLYGIDSLMRRRPERHPRLRRWVEACFARVLRVPFISGTNYPLLLFSSRAGRHANTILTIALMLPIAAAALHLISKVDATLLARQSLLSRIDTAGMTLDPQRYADQRQLRTHRTPAIHIPSEQIKGDWLRVFIPLDDADTAALPRLCPELGADAEPTAEALLVCMTLRFRLSIDGQAPAVPPDFMLARDPLHNHRGVVAMLDIRALAHGRHELALELGDLASPGEPAARRGRPGKQPVRIPFWR